MTKATDGLPAEGPGVRCAGRIFEESARVEQALAGIQEAHITAAHAIAELVDDRLSPEPDPS